MKRVIGCFTNCFGAEGVFAAASLLRSTGLDSLELALRGHNLGGLVIPESAVLTVDSPDVKVRDFLDLIQDQGVRVSGCNVGGANILTPEGLELTLRRIAFAHRGFGVPVVVSGAGQPADDAQRSTMIESLRTLGEFAGALGVTVALETHRGPTQNADAMLDLIARVDHPNIRLNFDTGNIGYYNRGADPARELERVSHLVRNVHLKDSRGGFEDWYFPALGEGVIDFRRIRAILDDAGFAGPYTIEIEGIAGEPEPGLDGRVERIARSARHLAECGYF
jgi:L-ribulose-5-phosphate 3-epimerase